MANAIYKPYCDNPVGHIAPQDMYRNQRVLSGTDPEYLSDDGIFFLDTLILESGKTVSITDGKNQSIVTEMISASFNNNHLRCDYGIKITGDVIMAKGYIVENVIKP
jgi:hypothetical protein